MKGKAYNYPGIPSQLHRWFISYEDKRCRYTEENFDTKREALERIGVLQKKGTEAELWTRERAIPGSRLRK